MLEFKISRKVFEIAFFGHVNHGKTTLLSSLINKNINKFEIGGITQNFKFYSLFWKDINLLFVDTPGHVDFYNIRKTIALIIKFAVIVVDLNEGFMPQTYDSLENVRNLKIPLLIAFTKFDLYRKKNLSLIKTQLNKLNYLHNFINNRNNFNVFVSSKSIDSSIFLLNVLIHRIYSLLTQKLDLHCVLGTILDVLKNKNNSISTLIFLKKGSININDVLVTKTTFCKIKTIQTLTNKFKLFGISGFLYWITGWVITPKVDEVFRKYHFKLSNINYLNLKHRYNSLIKNTRGIQVKNFSLNNQSEFYSINIIIKASTLSMLSSLNLCFNSFIKKNEYSSKIKYYILKQEVGPVNKNDVFLTNSSKKKTIILSFVNNKKSKLTFNELNVCLIEHDIIYKITEDLNEYLKKIIFNLDRCNLTYLGEAVVIQLFKINKKYQLLGCSLINGFFEENKKIEVLRNGVSLFKGVEIQRIEYLNRRVINTKAVQGNFCLKVLNNNVCINDIIKCL